MYLLGLILKTSRSLKNVCFGSWICRKFSLGKESRKFCREFYVELHGTDDDRELMALYNARREESGLVEYDRSVSRLREAVHEALVQRSHDEYFVLGS